MASITKIITALVVLEKYPLAAGESGPVDPDGAGRPGLLRGLLPARRQARFTCSRGGPFTERELLEIVARRLGGQLREQPQSLGLRLRRRLRRRRAHAGSTPAGSPASPSSSRSVSIRGTPRPPRPLVELGRIALADPLIAELVATTSLPMHDVGALSNTNELLGHRRDHGHQDRHPRRATARACCSRPSCRPRAADVARRRGARIVEPRRARQRGARPVREHAGQLPRGRPHGARTRSFASYATPWGDTAEADRRRRASPLTVWGDHADRDARSRSTRSRPAIKGDRVGEVVYTSGDQTVTVPLVLVARHRGSRRRGGGSAIRASIFGDW